MKTCNFCGTEVSDDEIICPKCNSTIEDEDVKKNKLMAVLAYFGPLVLIPIFAAPKSKFARFHANQGLILLIFNVICTILSRIDVLPLFIYPALSCFSLFLFVLFIIGIVNVAKGKFKNLPVIGNIVILKAK